MSFPSLSLQQYSPAAPLSDSNIARPHVFTTYDSEKSSYVKFTDIIVGELRDHDFIERPAAPYPSRGWPRCLLLSLGLHLAAVFALVGFDAQSHPEIAFERAAGSPYLEVDLLDIAALGRGDQNLGPDDTAAPERLDETVDIVEPTVNTEPLIATVFKPELKPEPMDLRQDADPPKTVAKKPAARPKAAKPPRAVDNPTAGGVAPASPGNILGSRDSVSASGGGGAGGKSEGQIGSWKAVRVPEPPYPEASKAGGEQGTVVVMVTVLPTGKVGAVSVSQSSGHSRLDQAALNAARRIIFKINGGWAPSEAVTVRVPYQFRLKK